jgi:hypothetical protein
MFMTLSHYAAQRAQQTAHNRFTVIIAIAASERKTFQKRDIKSWRNLSIAVRTHMRSMASNFNKLSLFRQTL